MYQVIYDITKDDYPIGGLLAIACATSAFGTPFFFARRMKGPILYTLFGGGFMLAGTFVACLALYGWTEHSRSIHALNNGNAKVVEGTVEKSTLGNMGHVKNYFKVGATTFTDDRNITQVGFFQKTDGSKEIHVGARVRVSHVNGAILKMEIWR